MIPMSLNHLVVGLFSWLLNCLTLYALIVQYFCVVYMHVDQMSKTIC